MDDLISRQAAIEEIESHIRTAEEPYYLHDTEKVMNYAFEVAASCVYNLPSAEPELQWIPCNERLPKEYGEYRITWTTSASKKRLIGDCEFEVTSEWDAERYRFKGKWLLDEYIKNYPDVNVIAWKPLEEPWKGEKDEKQLDHG